jgi:hypothetical protein
MDEMSLEEAQLFRLLVAFFGRDHVVWNMSVRAVCGGQYPSQLKTVETTVPKWIESRGCLFTIVDHEDEPKMVVEFAVDIKDCIDVELLERQQHLPSILNHCGVQYIVFSGEEFEDLLNPESSLDLAALLRERLGIEEA